MSTVQVRTPSPARYLTRLRWWRQEHEYSIRELAALAKVGSSTILRLEREEHVAHPRTVRKLAQALEIKPAELY